MKAIIIVVIILAALLLIVLFLLALMKWARSKLRKLMAPHFKSNTPTLQPGEKKKPGVLYVHMPDLRPWGNPNASPFSLKLETWLLMSKIPYVVIRGFDTKKAPKGKIPFIEIDDLIMGDSELIIQYLQKRFPEYPVPGDSLLTHAEKAVGQAFARMVSDCTVACMGYSRNVENIEYTLKAYTGMPASAPLPLYMRIVASLIRRSTSKRLASQGVGRHTRDEIYEIGCRDFKAISDFLGNKPFLLGPNPTTYDASVFAILASSLWVPVEFPMKTYAYEQLPGLDAYLLRVRDAVWGQTLEPWYTGGEVADRMRKTFGEVTLQA
ncbi:hypothetical protein PhCBS80983_g03479 [Powellomyces hirtus]|uniref:GST N-terminal domain-containing protein n=1 Tax=Powellomyces hirtus TaxID=109895 RepID=A0A507E253_9FUNG|nr:hypothetical protein PhCBS80983_g03479 [Powellomyces hirtus]